MNPIRHEQILIYIYLQKMYIKTARQLKRIDSVRRSPVYIHFQETIDGAPSIRAYRLQERFTSQGERFIDEGQMPYYMWRMVQR